MAEQPEERRDAEDLEPRDADPAPAITTVVGAVTSDPPAPKRTQEEQIALLNRENADRRKANEALRKENETLATSVAKLREDMEAIQRREELDKMDEVTRLKEEKSDALKQGEARERVANDKLRKAAILAYAGGLDLVENGANDVLAVINIDEIPLSGDIPDSDAVRSLVDSAVERRPHWKKQPEREVTPVPPDTGLGNPAPDQARGVVIETTHRPDTPEEAAKQANESYLAGKTSLPDMVHSYNEAWQKSQAMRTGAIFRKPESGLPPDK